MGLYLPGTRYGNYPPQGDVAEADFVCGFQFGWRKIGNGIANIRSAEFIVANYLDLPMIVDQYIGKSIEELVPGKKPDAIFSGNPTSLLGGGEGTKGEIAQAKQFMAERDLNSPLFVGQRFHIGRVAVQAEKQGLTPIIPEDLSGDFDPESEQPWTRNEKLWQIYEPIAEFILRRTGQL
jgi:hypothetical protein